MRAPISVIVPTLNAAQTLPTTLHCLMEGIETGLIRELIVCDGGSTDATCQIARDWGAVVIDVARSRGRQLRAGCRAAKGDWFLVLHADTQLSAGWGGAVAPHLGRDDAGWFRLAFDAPGLAPRLVAAWANLRSRFGLPYGDQGLLISRDLYTEVDGYPDVPLMEDVGIAQRLKGRLVALDATALTSATKYQSRGWIRQGGRNLWMLMRYLCGADPAKLAQSYLRK